MTERSVTSARRFVERLRRRGATLPEVPADCVIAHRDPVIRAARAMGGLSVDIGGQRPQILTFLRPEGRRPFAVVEGSVGAPAAAALVEELAEYGFTRLWCVGAAGHPAAEIPSRHDVGDMIVVRDALSYEGTSAHYAPGSSVFNGDPGMADALAEALAARAERVFVGRAATTDAIYRETPRFLADVIDRGAVALDMESSAVFSVAAALGLAAASAFVITDLVPVVGEWVIGLDDPRLALSDAALLPALLDAMEAV